MRFYLQRVERPSATGILPPLLEGKKRPMSIFRRGLAARCDRLIALIPPANERGRLVLAAERLVGAKVEETVEAESWLEAKAKLRYPLTTRQELILDRRKRRAA